MNTVIVPKNVLKPILDSAYSKVVLFEGSTSTSPERVLAHSDKTTLEHLRQLTNFPGWFAANLSVRDVEAIRR